jgi:glyceraldehyde 3-phosphate dehydrogenase
MKKKVAINGLGRIGKMVLWNYFTKEQNEFEIVMANGGSGTPDDLAYMLKFDSTHGRFPAVIEADDENLIINGHKIKIINERDPAKLPLEGIDIVLECTGKFTKRADAQKMIDAGAKKVLISAPAKEEDITVVFGVNEELYDNEKHNIVSNASCTTNSLAPVMKVLVNKFGVESAHITTTHAYTSSQVTIDRKKPGKHRRGRAAAVNIIPTTTGAAKATVKVIPELQGKMTAMALRVPTQDVAITEVVANLGKAVTAKEVNEALVEAAEGAMKGVLDVTYDEVVSSDMIGNPHSSTVDAELTDVVNGNMVKIMTWYDNEYGYASRLFDLAGLVASKM